MRVKLGASELVELGRKCKAGQTVRKGYRRKGYMKADGTRVAPKTVGPACVPGSTAPPSKRWLPDLGPNPIGFWTKDKSERARHEALRQKVQSAGCYRVRKDLNALRNVQRDGETKAKMTEDFNWLKKQGFCQLKSDKK
jgi:hypothetical protein